MQSRLSRLRTNPVLPPAKHKTIGVLWHPELSTATAISRAILRLDFPTLGDHGANETVTVDDGGCISTRSADLPEKALLSSAPRMSHLALIVAKAHNAPLAADG